MSEKLLTWDDLRKHATGKRLSELREVSAIGPAGDAWKTIAGASAGLHRAAAALGPIANIAEHFKDIRSALALGGQAETATKSLTGATAWLKDVTPVFPAQPDYMAALRGSLATQSLQIGSVFKGELARAVESMAGLRRWVEEWEQVKAVIAVLSQEQQEYVWEHLSEQPASHVVKKIQAFVAYGGVEYASETLLVDAEHYLHSARTMVGKLLCEANKARASAGGVASGRSRQETAKVPRSEVLRAWRQMLAAGVPNRETTAKLAIRFNCSEQHIRTIKKKAKLNPVKVRFHLPNTSCTP